ncbi:MAG TPA: hypothetical protein VNP03_06070 [Pseudonocardia sp.]|nr:hypothetical protein [Pseudonocardia sp.]
MSPVSRGRKKKRRTPPRDGAAPRAGAGAVLPPLRSALPPGARYTTADLGPTHRVIHRELTARGWALDTKGGDWGPAWYYPPSVPGDWDPDDPRWDEDRSVALTPTRLSQDRDRSLAVERAGPVRSGPLGEQYSYPDLSAVLAQADRIESWRATDPRTDPRWPQPPGGWPDWLWTVPYLGSAHPGAPDLGPIAAGANCQRYAYAVLELFGRHLPPLRSAELWADTAHSDQVSTDAPEPLDIWLFHDSPDPHGAHVGLWMCRGQVLHLCREVGVPAVWTPATFSAANRYSVLVGAKRPVSG